MTCSASRRSPCPFFVLPTCVVFVVINSFRGGFGLSLVVPRFRCSDVRSRFGIVGPM